MFGSLKQGNICYILIKGEKPILKIGTVESVSNPMPKYPTYNPSVPFGAQQETVIDAKIKAGEEVIRNFLQMWRYLPILMLLYRTRRKQFFQRLRI